jgi:hypothetical protein
MTKQRHLTWVIVIAVISFVAGAGSMLVLNGSFNLWYVLIATFLVTGFSYRELSKKIIAKKEPKVESSSMNNPDEFEKAIKKYGNKSNN